MDRKLIAVTSLFLFLQVALLLTDWPLVSSSDKKNDTSSATPIGYVLETKQAVKRRSHNSVVWEDSGAAETLLSYDSLLTLENSSAELNLQGDVHLSIHENTLIVLEPPLADNPNLLRIRFSRGQLLTQNKNRALQLDTQEWSLEAKPGSAISLKSLNGDKVEVEVKKGQVQLQPKDASAPAQKIAEGTRFQIADSGQISEKTQLSAAITFANPSEVHIYTHDDHSEFNLAWSGTAIALRQTIAANTPTESLLEKNSNQKNLMLPLGTTYLSLKGSDGNYTPETIVNVLPAPLIRYTSPLPRDRFAQNSEVYYSWMPLAGATSYHIELASAQGETREEFDGTEPFLKTKSSLEGETFVRVFGIDQAGFKIPPQYALPIYFVRDPLAPPQLFKPKIREPAMQKSDDSSFYEPLRKLWHYFIEENAFADDHTRSLNKRPLIVFSWQPVDSADFYNIEISSTPDFAKPEVIVKVEKESFAWSNYTQKIYYWRVAAGVNTGRMGLFSEVSKFDLTQLDTLNEGEIAPGVSIAAAKPVKKEAPLAVAAPISATPPPIAAPTSPTPPPAASNQDPDVNPVPTKGIWHITPRAELNFHYLTSTAEGSDFTSTEQGFVNASASLWLDAKRDDGVSYVSEMRFSVVKWSPTNSTTYPFQQGWTETYIALRSWRETTDNEWGWGGWAENTVRLQRSGFESLDPQTIWQIGPAVSYHTKFMDNMTIHSSFGFLFGVGVTSLETANSFDYTFLNRKFKPYIGGDIDLKLYLGTESYSGDDLTAGFHVGIHF
jgi:hypothetical protein